jgi:DNA-binding PadR family transcriptional regulator
MSTTRLLVLGAVRVFAPVHGYLVRRELLSWQVQSWANVAPGSIYNALRSLARDGLLVATESKAPSDKGPSRTTYELTGDGENEFVRLLRDALWNVHDGDASLVLAATSFMTALPRQEVLDGLTSREQQLERRMVATRHDLARLSDDRHSPAWVAEHLRLVHAYLHGELTWALALHERLTAGELRFRGEPGWPDLPGPDGRWRPA